MSIAVVSGQFNSAQVSSDTLQHMQNAKEKTGADNYHACTATPSRRTKHVGSRLLRLYSLHGSFRTLKACQNETNVGSKYTWHS